jgi:hypothetical protein
MLLQSVSAEMHMRNQKEPACRLAKKQHQFYRLALNKPQELIQFIAVFSDIISFYGGLRYGSV